MRAARLRPEGRWLEQVYIVIRGTDSAVAKATASGVCWDLEAGKTAWLSGRGCSHVNDRVLPGAQSLPSSQGIGPDPAVS